MDRHVVKVWQIEPDDIAVDFTANGESGAGYLVA
jgi:hypothetical protein